MYQVDIGMHTIFSQDYMYNLLHTPMLLPCIIGYWVLLAAIAFLQRVLYMCIYILLSMKKCVIVVLM